MRNLVMGIDLGFVNVGRCRSDKQTTSESEFVTASESEAPSDAESGEVHSSRALRRMEGRVRMVIENLFIP